MFRSPEITVTHMDHGEFGVILEQVKQNQHKNGDIFISVTPRTTHDEMSFERPLEFMGRQYWANALVTVRPHVLLQVTRLAGLDEEACSLYQSEANRINYHWGEVALAVTRRFLELPNEPLERMLALLPEELHIGDRKL